ncbi:putative Acylphosphate phosphohydrolase [Candidatus Hydrogenisulfobacillus filiaventi]|uniref:acylphosphatase n=1 Tax=Candidatus Hydrogenisulfobacillus filiaventi TaxID=2707344 RepID=A0A6F8ZH41_9FIRM|nr:putative Acylphosphate phosphohydrolase [Candidatus Hydrogenisulfobacillus filiaventi]
MRRARVLVAGRVQGVGFRAATRERALALGLTGRVANRPDGRVVAEVQGPEAAVAAFLAWVRTGPPWARVERVEAEDLPPDPAETRFEIRPFPWGGAS